MSCMEHADAVTRMQEYIESRLEEEITLHELAGQAGYSPWYCARMFKEYTGKAPFDYIRSLRLSKAALSLRDEKRKIVDVAMDFVFDSHEGFTRAFHKQFGLHPKAYRQHTPPIPLFNPYPVRAYHLLQEERDDLLPLTNRFHTSLLEFPNRKMILRRARLGMDYFEYVSEVGCDVWGMLVSVKEALYEPVGMWLPEELRPDGTSLYAQGVEVPADYAGVVPAGYEVMDLPACTMMLFQTDPYDEDRFDETIAWLSKAIDEYDPLRHGCAWADDLAPRIQLDPQGYRGYIEARPVKIVP